MSVSLQAVDFAGIMCQCYTVSEETPLQVLVENILINVQSVYDILHADIPNEVNDRQALRERLAKRYYTI